MLRPDDPGYDAARVIWNGMIDRRPAVIVRCRSAADVRSSVRYAREQGLAISRLEVFLVEALGSDPQPLRFAADPVGLLGNCMQQI